MKDRLLYKISKNVFPISIAVIVLFWIMESFIHTFAFKDGTFISNLCFPAPNELWMRMFTTGVFIIFGYFSHFLISGRLRLYEALQKSETQFREFVEGTDDLITQVDRGGNFTYVNHMSKKILGLEPEECVGLSAFSFVHPDDREMTARSFEKWIMEKSKQITIENRQVSRNGEINEMLWTVNSHFDKDGNVKYLNGIAVNITKRKEFEEELRKTNDQLHTSINSMSDAYIILDKNRQVTEWNNAAETIFGYSKDEMLGKNATDYIVRGDVRHLVAEVLDKLLSGVVADYSDEGNNTRKDGTVITCQWSNKPLFDKNGDVFGILSIAHDMTKSREAETEKKSLEQHLYHAQKMEAVGTLAAGIAHDFNNIIASIILNTEMMQMTIEEDDSMRENTDEILASSYRAANLIEQILTFSRQSESEKKPIHLTPLIKEVLKFLRSSYPSTIEITQSLSAKNDKIIGEPTQVNQLVMSLCGNSENAMREKGGTLSVELETVDLDEITCHKYSDIGPGKYVSLTVIDTGKGIRKSALKRVFDPFYTTKIVGEGSGLGLSVVHGIVKEYGGHIAIESTFNKGAAVRILFPAVDDSMTGDKKVPKDIMRGDERILIVDDEESIVSTLQKILIKLGYSVNGQTSSTEALAEFKKDPDVFDIILTDLTMPELTGLDLSREILALKPDIPIIITTGNAELIPQKQVREIGIQTILPKPVSIEKLTVSIRSLLDT